MMEKLLQYRENNYKQRVAGPCVDQFLNSHFKLQRDEKRWSLLELASVLLKYIRH
jgi:hypothetical protein